MKTVMLVLVGVMLGGCPPKTSTQGPPTGGKQHCLPASDTCVVDVAGVPLIRAQKLWLIDLRGHDQLDADAMVKAAKQCDGPQGCGVAMTRPQIEKLVDAVAPAKVQLLKVTGGTVVAHQLEKGLVLRVIDAGEVPEGLLRQLSTIPMCPECGWCLPGQCKPPPPPPGPRLDDFRVLGRVLEVPPGGAEVPK